MSKTMTCSYGSYYDPNTKRCHPCSDCTDAGRPPNEFCTKTCITEKCEGRQYYDTNLKKCFPCSDCEDPSMGSAVCMSTCRNIPTSTNAPTMLTTLQHSQSNNLTIISVVAVCSILLAVVLVIIAIIIYKYFGKRPGHGGKLPLSGTNEHLLPNGGGNTPPANGPNSLTANGHAVTSPTSSSDTAPDFDLRSVTVTNTTNTAFLSMPRNSSAALLSHHDVDIPRISTPLLNEHPASAIMSDGSHSIQMSMIHSMPVTIPVGSGQGQSSARSTPSTRHVSFSQAIGSSSTDGSGLHSDTEEGPIVTHPCENNGTCRFVPSMVSMPFSIS